MTVDEAIAAFRDACPDVPSADAAAWLDEIERTVRLELYDTHDGETAPYVPVPGRAGEDSLSVPEPYCVLYLYFLQMKSDLYLGDTAHYANSAALFAAAYDSFSAYINRTLRPLGESAVRM